MIYHGDSFKVLPTLDADSIDACITDPPYGIGFMNRKWDSFKPGEEAKRIVPNEAIQSDNPNLKGRHRSPASSPSAVEYNRNLEGQREFQTWTENWAREVYRVLKPGAHLLVCGAPRSYHRMACGLEDAGFEIRDCLSWLYGQGFPKSLDVSKAIDKAERGVPQGGSDPTSPNHGSFKSGHPGAGPGMWMPKEGVKDTEREIIDEAKRWAGWGTGLKPGWEPIVLARKPLDYTVAENVITHGTGAINIDATRINPGETIPGGGNGEAHNGGMFGSHQTKGTRPLVEPHNLGRWPANVVLSHTSECVQVGTKDIKGSNFKGHPEGHINQIYGKDHRPRPAAGYANEDGLETVERWECAPDCPVRMLDEQTGDLATVGGPKHTTHDSGMFGIGQPGTVYADSGGASRFFYTAKPSRSERDEGCYDLEASTGGEATERVDGTAGLNSPRAGAGRRGGSQNIHPTVKPTDLMIWLVKLITPPNGVVLDPFLGSGTTGIACRWEEHPFIGIEKEAKYVEIARRRITEANQLFAGEEPVIVHEIPV